MKKVLLAIVSFAVLIGMVACSNNENNESKKDNENEVNEQNVEPEEQAPENNGNTEDEHASDNEANVDLDQEGNIPENIADFEETATLIEQIDINGMNAQIETDNQNNRVIIYSEENKTKKYKSIFIKKQNRLKIISLDNDGQIFNEIIE